MTEKSRTQRYQELHDSSNEDEGTRVQSEDLSRYAQKIDQFSSPSSSEFSYSQNEPQFGSRTKATDYSQSVFGNEDSYLGTSGSQRYLDDYQNDNAQIDNLLRQNEELLNSTRSGNYTRETFGEDTFTNRVTTQQNEVPAMTRQTPSFAEPDFDIGNYSNDMNEPDEFLNDALNEAKMYNMERGERSAIDTTATILSELASSRQEVPTYVSPTNVGLTPKEEPLAEYASTIEDLLMPQTRGAVGQQTTIQNDHMPSVSNVEVPTQQLVEPQTQTNIPVQTYVDQPLPSRMESQVQTVVPTETYMEPQVQSYIEPQDQPMMEPQVQPVMEPQVQPVMEQVQTEIPMQTYMMPQDQQVVEPQVYSEIPAQTYVEPTIQTSTVIEEDIVNDYFSVNYDPNPTEAYQKVNQPQSEPIVEERPLQQSYMDNSNVNYSDDANASIEELTQKLEREKLFREEMLQDNKQMAMQMSEYESELTTVTKNVSRHDMVLNFVLVVCIIALFLVLFFIVYLALTNREIIPTVTYKSFQQAIDLGQKWLW